MKRNTSRIREYTTPAAPSNPSHVFIESTKDGSLVYGVRFIGASKRERERLATMRQTAQQEFRALRRFAAAERLREAREKDAELAARVAAVAAEKQPALKAVKDK